jgi:hypothetical protein
MTCKQSPLSVVTISLALFWEIGLIGGFPITAKALPLSTLTPKNFSISSPSFSLTPSLLSLLGKKDKDFKDFLAQGSPKAPSFPSGGIPGGTEGGGTRWNDFRAPGSQLKPPSVGSPAGGTEGGGTRGDKCPGDLGKDLTPLLPTTHLGRTFSAQPTLFIYVPTPLNNTVEFELVDEGDKTVYKKYFNLITKTSGIVALPIPQNDRRSDIQGGKNYKWYLTVKCNLSNDSDESGNPFVSGWINRVELNSTDKFTLEKASLPERFKIYTDKVLWYDALGTLAQLRRDNPTDVDIARQWTDLLKAVNLDRLSQKPLVESQIQPIPKTSSTMP